MLSETNESGPEGTPSLPDGIGEAVAGCSDPLLVPAGKAWIAEVVRAFEDGGIDPRHCDEAAVDATGIWAGRFVRRFRAGDLFLDTLEVTNSCYAACVAGGACPEPPTVFVSDDNLEEPDREVPAWDTSGREDFPVLVDVEHAEAFCRWRGGRLPTQLELARADHGEVLHTGNPALYGRTAACASPNANQSADCALLLEHGLLSGDPQHPVGSVPDDVGPFGHVDLFGGVCETTATVMALASTEEDLVCSYPEDGGDPKSFGDSGAGRGFFCPARSASWGGHLWDHVALVGFVDQEDLGLAMRGFRCAYDPVYLP